MMAPDGSGLTLIADDVGLAGTTESSGILDISGLVGYKPGSILLTDVQGSSSSLTVTVHNPKVVFTVRCASGAAPSASTLTAAMSTQSYAVTGSAWYPSGDQHSPLVYQAAIPVPDLCAGGQIRLDKGGTFATTVS